MKKIYHLLLFVSTLLLVVSCGMGDSAKSAEKYADKFYKHLKAKDYNSAVDMVDKVGLEASPREDWKSVLTAKDQCGELEKVKKKIGFNTSVKNGVTTVSLKYKTTYTDCQLHEKIVLVKRGDEYKVLRYEYNEDATNLSAD